MHEPSETLVAALRTHASLRPQDLALTFLEDGETLEINRTYAELDARAAWIAARLLQEVQPGSRAILAFRSSPAFVEAFFGCLYAGVIAVPVYPPRPREAPTRLESIVRACGAAVVLSTQDIQQHVEGRVDLAPDLMGVRWLAVGDDVGFERMPPDLHLLADGLALPTKDHVAFLQYTSGSTAAPKGVIVRHGNLTANFVAVGPAMDIGPSTTFLSWLPLNHDMGLIGIVLQAIYLGNRLVLMSPMHFLQRPIRWLSAISKYRATLSGAPNFAFDLCVERASAPALAQLDLSCWRVAFNGAEPIRALTLERFAETFSCCGFSRAALFPCYGLAESTLFTSGGSAGCGYAVTTLDPQALSAGCARISKETNAQKHVSCGRSPVGHELAIVEPNRHRRLPDGEIGEIWFRGASVAAGYWGLEEVSVATFRGRLDTGEGPFLRTGDLGFMKDGELYVTGRIKDLIVLRGRNIYPQDIERTVEQLSPAFVRTGVAAFADTADGTERLTVVQEVRVGRATNLEHLARTIGREVLDVHEVRPHRVALIRAGALPKTSSGKVRRAETRAALLAGTLPVVLDLVEGRAVESRETVSE